MEYGNMAIPSLKAMESFKYTNLYFRTGLNLPGHLDLEGL